MTFKCGDLDLKNLNSSNTLKYNREKFLLEVLYSSSQANSFISIVVEAILLREALEHQNEHKMKGISPKNIFLIYKKDRSFSLKAKSIKNHEQFKTVYELQCSKCHLQNNITRIANVSINLNVYVQSDVSSHSKSDIHVSH